MTKTNPPTGQDHTRQEAKKRLEILIPRGQLRDEDSVPYSNDVLWSLIDQLIEAEATRRVAYELRQVQSCETYARQDAYMKQRLAELESQGEQG